MNTYRIQYTRPYISNDSIHSEVILAQDEQQARDIFADCEVLSVTLDKRDYDQEMESQKNAARVWTSNIHVTDDDMDAVHNFIVAAEAGDLAAMQYGDKWLGELPPARITTLQELADAKERSFNRRYYNNPNGEPKFVYRSNRQP